MIWKPRNNKKHRQQGPARYWNEWAFATVLTKWTQLQVFGWLFMQPAEWLGLGPRNSVRISVHHSQQRPKAAALHSPGYRFLRPARRRLSHCPLFAVPAMPCRAVPWDGLWFPCLLYTLLFLCDGAVAVYCMMIQAASRLHADPSRAQHHQHQQQQQQQQ